MTRIKSKSISNEMINADYMNRNQLMYFKEKLQLIYHSLVYESSNLKKDLQSTHLKMPDMFDIAATQRELSVEIKSFARMRNQLTEVEKALIRIEQGEYGYCELTGEEIGIARLEAQPLASLCVEAQEMREKRLAMQKMVY